MLKILDNGVTKVREWFVGSGEKTRDGSDTPDVSRVSENTSGWDISYSGQTFEDFSSFISTPDSTFSRGRLISPVRKKQNRLSNRFTLTGKQVENRIKNKGSM